MRKFEAHQTSLDWSWNELAHALLTSQCENDRLRMRAEYLEEMLEKKNTQLAALTRVRAAIKDATWYA